VSISASRRTRGPVTMSLSPTLLSITFILVSRWAVPFRNTASLVNMRKIILQARLICRNSASKARGRCGYALANKGHDTRAIQAWLGHRSITSTAVYTALAPNRFKDFWRD
jgi:site-specific recombinase XerD